MYNFIVTYKINLTCKVGVKGLWIENYVLPNSCELGYPKAK